MTHDELRINLLRQAKNMWGWCSAMLIEREDRTKQEIVDIAHALQVRAYKVNSGLPVQSFMDDEAFVFMWQLFMDGDSVRWGDDPALIAEDLGITSTPSFESSEIPLVIGLILAQVAVTHLQSRSHKKHLFAATLMLSATEAADYWNDLRGITHCRIPDEKWVNIHNKLDQEQFRIQYRQKMSHNARKGANVMHDKPGGSRDKQRKILEIWKSGKYSFRDICAEQECAAIGMSFSAARKALRNTPEPG